MRYPAEISSGQRKISWGAEMSNSNRPPSRHEALALQQQQVVLEGPTGHIDTQSFTRQSIDAVQPMASTNVSFQFAEQFASVAVTGGQGTHHLMAGTSLQNTWSYEEFVDCFQHTWFEEDWLPLMDSQFIHHLGGHLFAGDHATYRSVLARCLSACSLPAGGLTLYKANCNFSTDQFTPPVDPKLTMEIFASFSAGEVFIGNATPVKSRLEWSNFKKDGEDDPIENDKIHMVDGLAWKAHEVNFGQFFSVNEQGLMTKEKSFGIVFHHKLDPMAPAEMHQWFLTYFNRLAQINGTQAAFRDGRMVVQAMQQQWAAAKAKAGPPLPAALPLGQQLPNMPTITIASMPAQVPTPVVDCSTAPVPTPVIDFSTAPVPAVPAAIDCLAPPMAYPTAPAPCQLPKCQLKFPITVDQGFFGDQNLFGSAGQPANSPSCKQQLKPLPPPLPVGPTPSAMPPTAPASPWPEAAGMPQVLGAGPCLPLPEASMPQVLGAGLRLPAQHAHLQPDQHAWDQTLAAREALRSSQWRI